MTAVPAIVSAQKHDTKHLESIATIATLFSGVSATGLGFSYVVNENKLESTVNGFWFISLVLSIAAAVNSVLGLSWVYHGSRLPIRNHGHHIPKAHLQVVSQVPWFITFWFQKSPLVFLTLSVACFDLGLVEFAYSSNQVRSHIVLMIPATVHGLTVCSTANCSVYFCNSTDGFCWHWIIVSGFVVYAGGPLVRSAHER